jgi:hypothetical protein
MPRPHATAGGFWANLHYVPSMPTPSRKHTPSSTELAVLDKSRRRCTLCFLISSDLTEKLGQIAHLDQDPSNFAEDNLAWMCLTHHSVYDSTTSQHKNYTMQEVKAARSRLYQLVEGNQLPPPTTAPALASSDKAIFDDILQFMKGRLIALLKFPAFAASSGTPYSVLDGLVILVQQRHGPEHEFLDLELEELRVQFLRKAAMFLSIVQVNTERVLDKPDTFRVREQWAAAYPTYYQQMAQVLDNAATELYAAYRFLIRAGRQKLEA